MCMRTHVHICVHMYVCASLCTCVHVRACMPVYMCAHVSACVWVYMCMCVYMRVCMHVGQDWDQVAQGPLPSSGGLPGPAAGSVLHGWGLCSQLLIICGCSEGALPAPKQEMCPESCN